LTLAKRLFARHQFIQVSLRNANSGQAAQHTGFGSTMLINTTRKGVESRMPRAMICKA
jgi:hypothetical protein